MLAALNPLVATRVDCPVCDKRALFHMGIVNGHGRVPQHDPETRAVGVRATAPAASLTPSEVALAKILAAWEEWPGRGDRADPEVLAMVAVHEALWQGRFISPGEITDKGRALLDRARKAGVL